MRTSAGRDVDPVIGAAVITGAFAFAGIGLQNRRLLRENRADHADVARKLDDVGDDVRDVKADVRDVKAEQRFHGRRLTILEQSAEANR